jgi:hypothetical protein
VTTAGDFAEGVYARSAGTGAYGAVSVTATGDISTAGYIAEGVRATSTDGPVTVSLAGVTTLGDFSDGVYARSNGDGANGAVSVTATGDISTTGYDSDGVFAHSGGGSFGPVTVSVAGVSTTGDFSEGVHARSYGAGAYGAVSVTATGDMSTTGYDSDGVFARSTDGPVTVSVAGVSTSGDFSHGVHARTDGTGADGAVSVTATGDISTTGYDSDGAYASSTDGPVTVSVAGVTTTGDFAEGVFARSTGTGVDGTVSVTATGDISTTGYYSYGVLAISIGSGPVTVSVAGVTTSGDFADGVHAASTGIEASTGIDAFGTVSVTATGTISTTGYEAEGVYATSANGGPVTVSVAGVTTSGDLSEGVDARSYGTGAYGAVSVTATGAISTTGAIADGVNAYSTDGPVTVSVAGVTTTGAISYGVDANSGGTGADGAVSVTATGTISTTGAISYGVDASSTGGPVTVSVADVSTTGAISYGVRATSTGAGAYGAVSVTATGAISTTGAISDGIRVSGTTSSILITTTGSVNSGAAYSIFSVGATVDTVSVYGGLSGTSMLNAGNDAVTFFSTANIAALTLFDAGADTDALTFDGLVAEIDADEFVNFETATFTNGASIFSNGVGASLLSAPDGVSIINGSTLRLGDLDDILGSVFIESGSSLLAFGNSPGLNTITGDLHLAGLLDLTDGDPDDQTNVTGLLDGQGGTIALDVSFAPGATVESDLVTFGGDLSGIALISVNPVASALPAGAPPPLVSFGGSDLALIELAAPVEVDGLGYGLVEDSGSYFLELDGTVTGDVAGALALSAAITPIDREIFGDLGSRIGTGDALRRPGMADGGNAVWARIGGAYHDGSAGGGLAEVDFDMTQFFAQIGVDAFRTEAGDGSVVGSVMAHYGQADGDVDQDGGGAGANFDVDTYGVGLGVTWYAGDGDTYVDATGMLNFHDIDNDGENTDGMSYTFGLEAGTRVPMGDTLSLAPMGQVVYSRADIDDMSLASALLGSGISIEDPESLEARALMMLELEVGEGSSVQFGGGLAYEFMGKTETTFGNGTQIETDFGGLSGELAARGQVKVSDTVTVFGDVTGRHAFDSDGVDSFGGLIGVKIDF